MAAESQSWIFPFSFPKTIRMTFTWQQGKITIESKRLFAQQEVTRDRFGDNQDAAVSFTKLDFTRVLFQAGKDLRH